MATFISVFLLTVAVTLPGEAVATKYRYDPLNRMVSVIYDDGSAIDYAYDGAGNTLSITPMSAGAASDTGLSHAVAFMQVLSCMVPARQVDTRYDRNGDGMIGLAEAIFALQNAAGAR